MKKTTEDEVFCVFQTPLGRMKITEGEGGVTSLKFIEGVSETPVPENAVYLERAIREINEYFSGERSAFTVPLRPRGTDFQRRVWDALQTIPFGQTRTYQEIARELGNENACRAVGGAIHKNPLLLLIPCHRVLGKDGGLTGFAAGIWRKEALLRLESEREKENRSFFLLSPGQPLWEDMIRYAETCPWRAGLALSRDMKRGALADWERVIAVKEDGEICGFCTVTREDCIPDVPYTPYIGFVFVAEERRGKRISQRLIQYAMDYLKSLGFSRVYLTSDHESLYEKYGFSVIDRKTASWGAEEKIYMRRL